MFCLGCAVYLPDGTGDLLYATDLLDGVGDLLDGAGDLLDGGGCRTGVFYLFDSAGLMAALRVASFV